MKSIEKPSPNQSWKIENLGQSPAHLLLMLRYEKGQRGAQAQLLIAAPHSNCNRPEPQSGEKQWLIALPLDPHHQKTERTNYRSWKKYGLAGNHYFDLSFCSIGYPASLLDLAFWQPIWFKQIEAGEEKKLPIPSRVLIFVLTSRGSRVAAHVSTKPQLSYKRPPTQQF